MTATKATVALIAITSVVKRYLFLVMVSVNTVQVWCSVEDGKS